MAAILASILSADYARLGQQVRDADEAGVDGVTVDIMDGSFVPTITFGPGVVRAIRPLVSGLLDVDLMIVHPEKHLSVFVDAGADRLIVHRESCTHPYRVLREVSELGVQAGIALAPGTPLSGIEELIDSRRRSDHDRMPGQGWSGSGAQPTGQDQQTSRDDCEAWTVHWDSHRRWCEGRYGSRSSPRRCFGTGGRFCDLRRDAIDCTECKSTATGDRRGNTGVVSSIMSPDLRIYASPEDLALAAAELFALSAQEAIARSARFVVALAGGATPQRTYENLSSYQFSSQVDWRAVHVFLADERHVAHDDDRSNFRMIRETLLDAVPTPLANVHPVQTQLPPQEAAAAYEVEIRSVLGDEARFDLIYLGLGADGHTASLFPGTSVLSERDRLVAEVYVPALDSWRVTLTLPALNAARQAIFLVSGTSKAEMLRQVIAGGSYPAAMVEPVDGQLVWLADREAAGN